MQHEFEKNKDNAEVVYSLSSRQVVTKYSLKTPQVISLLEALREPLSALQMREMCHRKDASYFRTTTLQPMLNDGVIVETAPDSKRSPKQTYFLTQKGTQLLIELRKSQ